MKYFKGCSIFVVLMTIIVFSNNLSAQDEIKINAGADFVSRYIWRGNDYGNAPSIQPSLALTYKGFEAGFWGAYTFSNNAQIGDELDAYLSYTFDLQNSSSLKFIVTDYYFPNAGIRMGNFNNYDNINGAGAHVLEAGISFTASESFPITLSAFYNFHNDSGKNSYFELSYPFKISDTDINIFTGATSGSKQNPVYYGAENFSIINVGISASKSIKLTNDFSLPVFVSFALNPRLEKSFLVFGISI